MVNVESKEIVIAAHARGLFCFMWFIYL